MSLSRPVEIQLEKLGANSLVGRCTQWPVFPQPQQLVQFIAPSGLAFYALITEVVPHPQANDALQLLMTPVWGQPALSVQSAKLVSGSQLFREIYEEAQPRQLLQVNQAPFDLARLGKGVWMKPDCPALIQNVVRSISQLEAPVVVIDPVGMHLPIQSLNYLRFGQEVSLSMQDIGVSTCLSWISQLLPPAIQAEATQILFRLIPPTADFIPLAYFTDHPVLAEHPLASSILHQFYQFHRHGVWAATPNQALTVQQLSSGVHLDLSGLPSHMKPYAYEGLLRFIRQSPLQQALQVVLVAPEMCVSQAHSLLQEETHRLVLISQNQTAWKDSLTDVLYATQAAGISGVYVEGALSYDIPVFLPDVEEDAPWQLSDSAASVEALPDVDALGYGEADVSHWVQFDAEDGELHWDLDAFQGDISAAQPELTWQDDAGHTVSSVSEGLSTDSEPVPEAERWELAPVALPEMALEMDDEDTHETSGEVLSLVEPDVQPEPEDMFANMDLLSDLAQPEALEEPVVTASALRPEAALLEDVDLLDGLDDLTLDAEVPQLGLSTEVSHQDADGLQAPDWLNGELLFTVDKGPILDPSPAPVPETPLAEKVQVASVEAPQADLQPLDTSWLGQDISLDLGEPMAQASGSKTDLDDDDWFGAPATIQEDSDEAAYTRDMHADEDDPLPHLRMQGDDDDTMPPPPFMAEDDDSDNADLLDDLFDSVDVSLDDPASPSSVVEAHSSQPVQASVAASEEDDLLADLLDYSSPSSVNTASETPEVDDTAPHSGPTLETLAFDADPLALLLEEDTEPIVSEEKGEDTDEEGWPAMTLLEDGEDDLGALAESDDEDELVLPSTPWLLEEPSLAVDSLQSAGEPLEAASKETSMVSSVPAIEVLDLDSAFDLESPIEEEPALPVAQPAVETWALEAPEPLSFELDTLFGEASGGLPLTPDVLASEALSQPEALPVAAPAPVVESPVVPEDEDVLTADTFDWSDLYTREEAASETVPAPPESTPEVVASAPQVAQTDPLDFIFGEPEQDLGLNFQLDFEEAEPVHSVLAGPEEPALPPPAPAGLLDDVPSVSLMADLAGLEPESAEMAPVTVPVVKTTPASTKAPLFQPGERVKHHRYGQGVIKRVITMNDEQVILNINFEGIGKRLLDPRLTQLEKVS